MTAAISGDDIRVTWSAGAGGGAVASYRILRNGTQIGQSAAANFTDTRITGRTAYAYTVIAVSAAGASAASAPANLVAPPRYTLVAAGLLDGQSTEVEQARDVAIAPDGSIYIVGGTSAANFPVTPGAYDTSYNAGGGELGSAGQSDAFVAKLSPAGTLLWATYLGSPNYDRAYAVEVAPDGAVIVAGRAGRGFPTTAGALQTQFAGDATPAGAYGPQDGFIAKLSVDGRTLLWATYFGGANAGIVRDIDVAANGEVLIAAPMNGNLPYITGNAAQPTRRGAFDAVFARLSADGASIVYATYVGGTETVVTPLCSCEPSVRAGPNGSAYFLTFDTSNDFPLITPGAFQTQRRGGSDFIVVRFAASGVVDFATYLGGGGDEISETHGLAVDASGRAYIAATSTSSNFPMAGHPYQSAAGGAHDGVLAVLSPDGRSLLHASYFGGSADDGAEGVSLRSDATGVAVAVIVSGAMRSSNLTGTPDALRLLARGGDDGFVAEFTGDLSHLRYLSFFGGGANDSVRGNAIGPNGVVAVAGQTSSPNGPSQNAFDTALDGAFGASYGLFSR